MGGINILSTNINSVVPKMGGSITQATGYTDNTGSDRHNQRLSERRAAAMQAELVADGIPADEIITAGRGENDLAVPTAKDVNEPRNR